MVLKMTIDKVIKELGLKATAENTDLSTAKATPADVYFTSHELLNDLQASRQSTCLSHQKYMDVAEVKMQMEKFLAEREG